MNIRSMRTYIVIYCKEEEHKIKCKNLAALLNHINYNLKKAVYQTKHESKPNRYELDVNLRNAGGLMRSRNSQIDTLCQTFFRLVVKNIHLPAGCTRDRHRNAPTLRKTYDTSRPYIRLSCWKSYGNSGVPLSFWMSAALLLKSARHHRDWRPLLSTQPFRFRCSYNRLTSHVGLSCPNRGRFSPLNEKRTLKATGRKSLEGFSFSRMRSLGVNWKHMRNGSV